MKKITLYISKGRALAAVIVLLGIAGLTYYTTGANAVISALSNTAISIAAQTLVMKSFRA